MSSQGIMSGEVNNTAGFCPANDRNLVLLVGLEREVRQLIPFRYSKAESTRVK